MLFLAVLLFTARVRLDSLASNPGPADPSGLWKGPQGDLSLMLAGETLAFSYVSVFGPAAHICEGGGVAKRVGDGRYEFRDDQGTVAFLIGPDAVRLEPADGIASFCGANWPGETFVRDGYKPPRSCVVSEARAYFHAPGPLPPSRCRAYVVSGDPVEIAPIGQSGEAGWVLARFKGPRGVTAGLLRAADLKCGAASRFRGRLRLPRTGISAVPSRPAGDLSEFRTRIGNFPSRWG